MRKKILIISIFVLPITVKSYSQARTCGSITNVPYLQQASPSDYQSIMNLESFIQSYITSVSNGSNTARLSSPNSTIIIPVVVHVLHRGEAVGVGRNITDAQIQSQISVLNEDLRRLNANSVNTPVPFQAVASDPNFEFRLACVDPNGNLTNGITRTLASKDFYPENNGVTIDEVATGIKFTAQGGKDAWPTNKYLNIWVCNITALLYGYGQRPDKYSTQPNTDGVVVHYTSFGRTGNVSTGISGRVCTHEIGHWLGLLHPWGDVNCGNDFVDDTPPQESSIGGCPAIFPTYSPYCPGNDAQNTANGVMFMNFMQQTDDNCKNLFTKGQALRMRSMFATVNGIAGPRKAFIDNYFLMNQPPVICNTGTINVTNPNCLPVTWTIVSGPLSITSGQGTSSIVVQKSGDGLATIRATAGGYIDEKTVSVGLPVIGSNNPVLKIWTGNASTDYNNVCNLQTTYTNMSVFGANSVVWSRTAASPTNTSWSQSGNNINFYFWGIGQTAVFRITAANGCGSKINNFGFKSISCGGGGGGGCDRYQISPNPTSNYIKIIVPNIPPPCRIAVKSEDLLSLKISIKEIKVFDIIGNIVLNQKENKSKQAEINVSNLRTGIYFIEISDGEYRERHQIKISQ